jgi:hypothetical protein
MRGLTAALVVVIGGAACAGSGSSTPRVDPEEAAVLAVVQQFFDSMTARDEVAAAETLIIEGQFMSAREGANGPATRATPLATYVEGLTLGTSRQEERMWDPVVMVRGGIAMVWTPYDFHTNDQLTHCGIDVFSLLKTRDGWRIAGVTYTVEPDGCAALGQPAR